MAQIWSEKRNFNSMVASAADRSGMGVLMLFLLIYCLLLLPIFVESLSCMQYSLTFWLCGHLAGEKGAVVLLCVLAVALS